MQKPKPYRSPRRTRSPAALAPRRLRRPVAEPADAELDIVFEWEDDAPTQH